MNIQEKLTKIAEDMPKVYEAGKAEGKQSEYDAFWDVFLDFGNRRDYSTALGGLGWNEQTFKPKYDIIVTNAYMMFGQSRIEDLPSALKKSGVVLDTSQCTTFQYMFLNSHTKKIGIIDTRSASALVEVFGGAYLTSIEKLILKEDGSQTFTNAIGTSALIDIVVEGVIGNNGFSVSRATKLSHDSITSIVNALSTTTSGLTVTLSKTAVNNAFATGEGAADGSTSAEWLALVATRSNWTIALS